MQNERSVTALAAAPGADSTFAEVPATADRLTARPRVDRPAAARPAAARPAAARPVVTRAAQSPQTPRRTVRPSASGSGAVSSRVPTRRSSRSVYARPLAALCVGAALAALGCGGGGDEPAAEEPTPASQAGAEEAANEAPAPPSGGLLAEGSPAPAFELMDQSGAARTLAAEQGRPIVLYFYPRDATPGCTTEACAFRDAWDRYQQVGAQVFGVSTDSVDSHRAFAEEHELPFPLLADTDGAVAAAYGVETTGGFARRVTFLIGPDGTVRRVFAQVDPAVHADEVLEAIAALEP